MLTKNINLDRVIFQKKLVHITINSYALKFIIIVTELNCLITILMEVATLICTVLTFVIKDPRCTGNARIVNEWRIDPLRNKGKARTTDYGRPISKSQNFGLRQTNCADIFWGIWGIFGQFISTHFGIYCVSLAHLFYESTITSTNI